MARRARRRELLGALLAVVVVAAGLIAVWASRGSASPREPVGGPAAKPPTPSPRYSLAGTTPDGGARASADDTLLLTPDLIRLFEYYLSTVGERPLADIRSQIERDLDGRLGPNAARQAKDVLGRYLAYKDSMKAAQSAALMTPAAAASGAAVDRLRASWRSMQQTRARFFTAAESAALFGPEDAAAQAALDRLAAEQDPVASPEERRRRLAALDKAAPEATQAREASNLVNRLNDDAQRILANGGTQDDVYRMRAAAVSPEAANRLADVDRDEAQWKSRIADYLQQRGALASAPDADTEIARLRAQMFTPEEQRRLPAYER